MSRIKQVSLSTTLVFFSLFIISDIFAANLFVDQAVAVNGSNYEDIAVGNGKGYSTINSAIQDVAPGDTIYMRGGIYYEHEINLYPAANGTSWNEGDYIKLTSYPGEWAKIDGQGNSDVFHGLVGYNNQDASHYTSYWVFERFEVTNADDGFWMKGGPMKFRYMYIHDNKSNSDDGLHAGIFIQLARDCVIEYCAIVDNQNVSGPIGNNGNIIFDADYKDTGDNDQDGLPFDPDAVIKNNTIRYNYISGSVFSIRTKNQQRFGWNSRNPNSSTFMTYKNWGDKIHHNILINNDLTICQDFAQIFNNIVVDGTISANRYDDTPAIYKNCVYNNTVLNTDVNYIVAAGENLNGSSRKNYFTVGSQRYEHPVIWLYNNISHGVSSGYMTVPFKIAHDMPSNLSSILLDASELVVENNLIHKSSYSHDTKPDATFIVGHAYDASFIGTKDYQYKNTAEFNSFSELERGVSSVKNWDNDSDGLFVGSSGADQYITNGNFVIEGGTIVSSGGKGGSHPYLQDVSIPVYVGATNPTDNVWVAGVLGLVNVSSLKSGSAADPTWIEGEGGEPGGGEVPGVPLDFHRQVEQ